MQSDQPTERPAHGSIVQCIPRCTSPTLTHQALNSSTAEQTCDPPRRPPRGHTHADIRGHSLLFGTPSRTILRHTGTLPPLWDPLTHHSPPQGTHTLRLMGTVPPLWHTAHAPFPKGHTPRAARRGHAQTTQRPPALLPRSGRNGPIQAKIYLY